MIKSNFVAALSCIVISCVALTTLSGCGRCSSRNNTNYVNKLGYGDSIKSLNDLNEKFIAQNPTHGSFNVFIESSMSMDGYVNGHSELKTNLHRIINLVESSLVAAGDSTSLFYINSDTIPIHTSPSNFATSLSPSAFAAAGGDRTNSDIADVFRNVVNNTPDGTLSMLVSDCVYSPESAADLDKALDILTTDIYTSLKKKIEKNPRFTVMLLRFESNFNGIFYNMVNNNIPIINRQMPYFVIFMGDVSLLGQVHHALAQADVIDSNSAKKGENDVVYEFAGIPHFSYFPISLKGESPKLHITAKKTDKDGQQYFSFTANLSYLPLSSQYVTNTANYICGPVNGKNKKGKNNTPPPYSIESISPEGESGEYTFKVKYCGQKNSFIPDNTLIEISLKSLTAPEMPLPAWIDNCDDPLGTAYDNGYCKSVTFGLKSIARGISDAYKESTYLTFKFVIN